MLISAQEPINRVLAVKCLRGLLRINAVEASALLEMLKMMPTFNVGSVSQLSDAAIKRLNLAGLTVANEWKFNAHTYEFKKARAEWDDVMQRLNDSIATHNEYAKQTMLLELRDRIKAGYFNLRPMA